MCLRFYLNGVVLRVYIGRNRFERGYGSGGFKTMMVRRLWLVLMLSVDVFN